MQTFKYLGTAYKQALDRRAPWLVTFVAPAEQLAFWAGIPRRTDRALVGFQRPDEEPRVARAKAYFNEYGLNQSPTSLVLGLHPATGDGAAISLDFEPGTENESIRPCTLTISVDLTEPIQKTAQRLIAQISQRLRGDDALQLAESEEVDSDLGTEEAPIDDENGEDADSGMNEFELGRSLLQELVEKLQDASWVDANATDIRDLAKPATVIDGQHRLLGARLCERNIPFSVIAIHDCTWAEQVFQFTVVNYTAKGIPDQFITANAALSLTAGELQDLESRLQQAGVKVIEYELMRVINFDPESPFRDLVNLTSKASESLIGYKTMVQVGKAWFLAKDSAVKQIVDSIYPDLKGKGAGRRRMRIDRWKQDDWGLFFKDFWTIVRDRFLADKTHDGSPLWGVGKSNLMIAAVLLSLQEQFLTNLAAQDESFFNVPDDDAAGEMRARVRKRANTFISYFAADFFGQKWKMKSLNTGAGRTALREVMRAIVDTRGVYQYKKSALFTNTTSPAA
jgi:hypothetical protein